MRVPERMERDRAFRAMRAGGRVAIGLAPGALGHDLSAWTPHKTNHGQSVAAPSFDPRLP